MDLTQTAHFSTAFATSGRSSPQWSRESKRSSSTDERIAAEDSDMLSRKLALLKRTGLFGHDTKGAVIERAWSAQDLRDAYRLVHSVYVGNGYIGPEPSGLRLRMFEMSSETATFVAKLNGCVIGVLSVVNDSPDLGLPSDVAFKPELDELRAKGKRLCEVTNQAVAEEFRKSAVPTELMRCAIALMLHAGHDLALATVSPSHKGFYDLMKFREVGSQRSYSKKVNDPVIALGMELSPYRRTSTGFCPASHFIHGYLTTENHFVALAAGWAKKARRHFLNPDLLEELFVKERNFIGECSDADLRILQRRWGCELFGEVAGLDYVFSDEDAAHPTSSIAAADTMKHEPSHTDSMFVFAGHMHAFIPQALTHVLNFFFSEIPQKTVWAPISDTFDAQTPNARANARS